MTDDALVEQVPPGLPIANIAALEQTYPAIRA